MALRKVHEAKSPCGARVVGVFYDSEWEEFKVRVIKDQGKPVRNRDDDKTYHTSDRDDAIATAQKML